MLLNCIKEQVKKKHVFHILYAVHYLYLQKPISELPARNHASIISTVKKKLIISYSVGSGKNDAMPKRW